MSQLNNCYCSQRLQFKCSNKNNYLLYHLMIKSSQFQTWLYCGENCCIEYNNKLSTNMSKRKKNSLIFCSTFRPSSPSLPPSYIKIYARELMYEDGWWGETNTECYYIAYPYIHMYSILKNERKENYLFIFRLSFCYFFLYFLLFFCCYVFKDNLLRGKRIKNW